MFLLFDILPAALVPIFIFVARILDVSMGTLRIMFVSKGMKARATILGFFEVFIWIVIVAQVFHNLDNWMNLIAFAAGFAAGTYVGMLIEEKMQVGIQMFQIVTNQPTDLLMEKLRESGFRITCLNAEGAFGSVRVIFTIARRKRWKELVGLIQEYAPHSFYSVKDVKYSSDDEGAIPDSGDIWSRMLRLRKGK